MAQHSCTLATWAVQARFLRASRKHLHNVYLVAVTADAVPTFGDAAVAYARWDFSHRSVRDQSLRIVGSVLGALALIEAARRRGAAKYLVAAWALLLARLRGTSQACLFSSQHICVCVGMSRARAD